ncbi:MAG: oligosaccharide flippase family protein [Thermodesulfobacteriota bacterium]
MTLARSGSILFVGTMAGNFSNYLFQFFMGKYLPVEDYGTMNAVFSMLVIVAIPSTTIMLVLARYVSIFMAESDMGKISSLYRNSLKKIGLLGCAFFLPFLLFRTPIAGYLNITSTMPVVIIGAAVMLTFIVTVNFGILQGLQKFYYLGAGMGSTGVLKLLSGVILVFFGLGLNGAVASVVCSSLLVFAFTSVPLAGYYAAGDWAGPVQKHTRDIVSYSMPVLASTFAITVLTNVDLILVKHFFPALEAGLYASIAILGKTILYLPAAFVLALFPIVSGSKGVDDKTFRILDRALLYTVGISLAGVLLFTFFSEVIIKICFGDRYLHSAPLLKYYAFSMMSMAVMTVLVSFNLARSRTGFLYILAAGAVSIIGLLTFFHGSLLTIVLIIMSVNFLMALTHLWMTHRERSVFLRQRIGGERDGNEVGFYNYPG